MKLRSQSSGPERVNSPNQFVEIGNGDNDRGYPPGTTGKLMKLALPGACQTRCVAF